MHLVLLPKSTWLPSEQDTRLSHVPFFVDIVNEVELMGALLAEEGPILQLGHGSEIWSSGLASLDTLLGDAII